MKPSLWLLSVFALIPAAVLPAAAQTGPVAQSPAVLGDYLQDGAAAGFVATAVAGLGACGEPFSFRERRRDTVRVLEILCSEGSERRFARLTFVSVHTASGWRLRPFRIEFLP